MADPGLTARISVEPAPSARAALIALGWTPPQDENEPETDLWHVLVHVPQGRAPEIPDLLTRLGFVVYRMWLAGEDKP